jgi:hypothetical protein
MNFQRHQQCPFGTDDVWIWLKTVGAWILFSGGFGFKKQVLRYLIDCCAPDDPAYPQGFQAGNHPALLFVNTRS